jgi:hypothetical protein
MLKFSESVIPIRPGRNIAIIIEVAAMNERLRREGSSAIGELDKELIRINRQRKEKRKSNPNFALWKFKHRQRCGRPIKKEPGERGIISLR